MLYGAGNLLFLSKELGVSSIRGESLLYPPLLASFELTSDSNLLEAKALIGGRKQVVAAAINEETWTMNTSTEFVDWTSLQFGLDELAQTSSDIVVPQLKSAAVGAANTIVDDDLTTGADNDVRVYKATYGTKGRLFFKVVATAPAAADEVQLGAGLLTFHSSIAVGEQIQYTTLKAYDSMETIGVENEADSWGRLEFWGLAYGTEFPGQMLIRVPSLSRISVPSISVAGDVSTLDVEFRAEVPTGKRKPYELYELNTGVAA